METILEEHHRVWLGKPVLRMLYQDWYRRMLACRGTAAGPTVELGAGTGNLKEFQPGVIATDIQRCGWLDSVLDAQELPFRDGSVGNLLMVDVLHHVASPAALLKEMARVLPRGGRAVMLEPYLSPVSRFCYALFHQEKVCCDINPLADSPLPRHAKDPFEGNGAVPTLIFWKRLAEFQARFPSLRLVDRHLLAMAAYPLSGGFKNWCLLTPGLTSRLLTLEEKNRWLLRCLAFRCLVVLEKTGLCICEPAASV